MFALNLNRLGPEEPGGEWAVRLLARSVCIAPGDLERRDFLPGAAPMVGDELERLHATGFLTAAARNAVSIHRLLAEHARATIDPLVDTREQGRI